MERYWKIGIKERRDSGLEECGRGEVLDRRNTGQDRWDAGLEGRGQEGCRTGGMQDRRDSGQEGCRKLGMQDRWDSGRGMQDR